MSKKKPMNWKRGWVKTMNKTQIIGRLTRDPQLRVVNTSNGSVNVCDIDVAVTNRRDKDHPWYFRCSCWRGLADVAYKYLAKGLPVYLSGPVSCRVYSTQSGENRAAMEIQVEELELIASRGDADDRAYVNKPAEVPAAPVVQSGGFTNVVDDDLPF